MRNRRAHIILDITIKCKNICLQIKIPNFAKKHWFEDDDDESMVMMTKMIMILITLIRGDDEDGDGDDDEYDNDDDYSQGWEEVGGGERDPEASGQHHEGRARPSQDGLIFLKTN